MSNQTRRGGAKPASGRRSRTKAKQGPAGSAGVRRIVVPIDFSKSSLEALRQSRRYADTLGAQFILVHVIEPIPPADFRAPLVFDVRAITHGAQRRLKELCRGTRRTSPPRERASIRHGPPYLEIVAAARELKANLILMATHGFTGWKHALLGSTAERVVRHAGCPVLVLRGSPV